MNTDSLWSKITNRPLKAKEIQKMLDISDEGHIGIQRPEPMKLTDYLTDFYETPPEGDASTGENMSDEEKEEEQKRTNLALYDKEED